MPACPVCGQSGQLRDHVDRILSDLPVVGHLTRLRVRLPRFTCSSEACEATIFRKRSTGSSPEQRRPGGAPAGSSSGWRSRAGASWSGRPQSGPAPCPAGGQVPGAVNRPVRSTITAKMSGSSCPRQFFQ
uniref:transposase family protein n=1 Tax=Rhodococcus oryzae TaxID=2571143 RepID=UPI003CCC79D0